MQEASANLESLVDLASPARRPGVCRVHRFHHAPPVEAPCLGTTFIDTRAIARPLLGRPAALAQELQRQLTSGECRTQVSGNDRCGAADRLSLARTRARRHSTYPVLSLVCMHAFISSLPAKVACCRDPAGGRVVHGAFPRDEASCVVGMYPENLSHAIRSRCGMTGSASSLLTYPASAVACHFVTKATDRLRGDVFPFKRSLCEDSFKVVCQSVLVPVYT